MIEASKGNTFCQITHDRVTLQNKSKYISFGLQFTNNRCLCNHVVALAFKKVKISTTKTVSELGEGIVKERTQINMKQIVSSTVQNAAAKSVAKAWDLEVETCDMHDGDKVDSNAVGRLVRKDGRKNIANSFPPGQEMERKLNAQANFFSSSHTNHQ
eukprot:2103360-Ditylum_brightwellii.AAC.1